MWVYTCFSVHMPQRQGITSRSYFLCVLMSLLVWACALLCSPQCTWCDQGTAHRSHSLLQHMRPGHQTQVIRLGDKGPYTCWDILPALCLVLSDSDGLAHCPSHHTVTAITDRKHCCFHYYIHWFKCVCQTHELEKTHKEYNTIQRKTLGRIIKVVQSKNAWAKTEDLGSMPIIHRVEGKNGFLEAFSDLHVCRIACACRHTHTHQNRKLHPPTILPWEEASCPSSGSDILSFRGDAVAMTLLTSCHVNTYGHSLTA